ncbi:16S rRNA (cytosine(967)-C(5))-methyltransferase RsmB [Alkalicoccus luteus]|uniref:16S rRNA (cytosine(967)-C(5))-methyltransferase n=1 Tax=Alkalicoccus luteus TaxID=1237094 RepID=A0A969PQ74_9BACI|nr:16S rRNA (cytosine(967)-C(5))-methyltransferase RsmB [Alkalicoccus luteus]NJP36406.1 16S rRNA (cytosine(967)-C(5))-methyltransferase RsmB [Alkalicoccus luteus]
MAEAPVREAALDALLRIEKNQAYSNLLLDEVLKKHKLSDRDSGLLTQIVYGTLQHQRLLENTLAAYSNRPPEKLSAWMRQLLLLSLFQLKFLDRVPDHAVVNEAVNIAAKRGHKGISGMVNGILRSVIRKGFAPIETADPLQKTAIETSHPDWMINRWTRQYGAETAAEIATHNNTPPVTSIRVNTALATPEAVRFALEEDGLSIAASPLFPYALRVSGGNAAVTEAFKKGWFSIQDEGSMASVQALNPEKGDIVLDACAAPGGKACMIAERLENTGRVTARDLHAHKVKLIESQAFRLQLTNLSAETGDARTMAEKAIYDKILVDAPCSGLGVIRRKPDMKWTKQEADIERLSGLQKDILDKAWHALKPGGRLVYSTCTIDEAENEAQLLSFLDRHDDAEPDNTMKARLPGLIQQQMDKEHALQLIPGKLGTDGFFICSITKMNRQER